MMCQKKVKKIIKDKNWNHKSKKGDQRNKQEKKELDQRWFSNKNKIQENRNNDDNNCNKK